MAGCSGLQKWSVCTTKETELRDYNHTRRKTFRPACVLIRFLRPFPYKDGEKYIKRYYKVKLMVRNI